MALAGESVAELRMRASGAIGCIEFCMAFLLLNSFPYLYQRKLPTDLITAPKKCFRRSPSSLLKVFPGQVACKKNPTLASQER
jgi:hypothetical protein